MAGYAFGTRRKPATPCGGVLGTLARLRGSMSGPFAFAKTLKEGETEWHEKS